MSTTDFHLAGPYAPVHDELTAYDLPVTGALPPELTGWYLRNGPNPRAANAHWFTGEGMVHGVRLENGRAAWYRNRWVRTPRFADPDLAVHRADGTRNLHASLANTHVVNHAGHTLALVESSLPWEITTELDTLGPYDFGGALHDSMTAHPKICPETGELHFFGYGSLTAPHVTYHRADAAGNLVCNQPVDVPGLTMMHDFALTRRRVVFFDLPVVFDPERSATGAMPYRWSETYGARLGVLDRADPAAGVRWLPVDPCYVFHTLNAHDGADGADGAVVVHVVRYGHLFRADAGAAPGSLWRCTIDPAAGTVAEDRLDDRDVEFPRIDDRLAGADARFGHATTEDTLVRYDLHTGAVAEHVFGPGATPGEAVFVPADDRPGGAGWLLGYVHHAAGASDLVVLDAQDLAAPPVATVHLPCRVPLGFHGNWLPER